MASSQISPHMNSEIKNSMAQSNIPKLQSTFIPAIPENKSSDIHQKEALGHGIFFVRSRLNEGRKNFEKIKVNI